MRNCYLVMFISKELLGNKHKVKIKVNAEINLSSAEKKMNNSDTLMATAYIKGGKEVQVSIEELADHLHNNADKIETRHPQTAWSTQENRR